VSRLSYDANEKKLKREFEEFGPVKRVRLVENAKSGGPRRPCPTCAAPCSVLLLFVVRPLCWCRPRTRKSTKPSSASEGVVLLVGGLAVLASSAAR
jgi:RNA recognition motif. (a.k.a. RRM, RBD, or RNP domain)